MLHSPTLSATKWWPGGMGKTATHAVVMARLFIAAKDYGPHAFIVQLRSLETHLPISGVKVGDIGPKFGYGGVDNGFMSLVGPSFTGSYSSRCASLQVSEAPYLSITVDPTQTFTNP